MYNNLSSQGINVPNGLATSASAFWQFIDENELRDLLVILLKQLDRNNFSNLKEVGSKARELILKG